MREREREREGGGGGGVSNQSLDLLIFCLHIQALGGVIAMDIVGVLRGWKFFDHAGHLGGVLFAVYVDLSTVTD